MAVPLFDNATPMAPLRETILERIAEVVAGGQFILGPNVTAFEEEFAAYLGAATSSGSPTAPTRSPSPCAPSASSPATMWWFPR